MGVSNPLNSGSDPKWSFGSLPALLLWLAIKPLSGNRLWSSSSFSTKYQTLSQRFSLVGCWGKIISGWICWNSYNLLFQPLPSTIYPLSYKWGILVKLSTVCRLRFNISLFTLSASNRLKKRVVSDLITIINVNSYVAAFLDFTWHHHRLPGSCQLQTGVGTFDTIYSHMQVADSFFSSG